MFIHSLIFTILIIWYAQYFVSQETVERFIKLFQELIEVWSSRILPLIIVWVILAIWYWILPPVWEAAMLIYKQEGRQQWTTSLSKGFGKFFPMFEYHAATWLFQIHVIVFAVMRMYWIWIINNWLIITLLIIRAILSIFVTIFFSYSRMYIVIEWEGFFDAMKKSASLAMHNIWITVQFSVLTFALWLRFLVNILVLVGIPLWIIYLWTWLWLDSILLLKIAFAAWMIFLIFLVSYIEWIIEAFFITCWRKVRRTIKDEDFSTQVPLHEENENEIEQNQDTDQTIQEISN